jgi:ribose/xylose/arabinose/galactoside ABC-type transport system permease subunit
VVIAITALCDSSHGYRDNAWQSLVDNLRSVAPVGILALGAVAVIIAGGIDLSVASLATFTATISIIAMMALCDDPKEFGSPSVRLGFWGISLGLLAGVVTGFMVGTLHAWMIVALRLPPFIVTLGTLVGLRSFSRGLCQWANITWRGNRTEEVTLLDPFFGDLSERVFVSFAVWVILALILWIILSRTVLGRHIYALGGNEQAALLSGIRTHNVKWFVYAFSGVAASIAGIFYLAAGESLKPTTMAPGHELNAIAAAVVGGASLQGGIGTVQGTLLGVVFLQAIMDAVRRLIKGSSSTYEGLIVGIVVVLAVTVSQLRQIVVRGRQIFSGALGLTAIPILALAAGALVMMTVGARPGAISGVVALVVLGVIKGFEVARAKRGV